MVPSDLAVWNVRKQTVDTGSKKNANKIIFTTMMQIRPRMSKNLKNHFWNRSGEYFYFCRFHSVLWVYLSVLEILTENC